MMTKPQPDGNMNYQITNKSGDHEYFVMVPRIVYLKAKNAYQIAFYLVVKDIAGEKGDCYLAGEDLALLCSMSEGMVTEARKFWEKQGFITAEKKKTRNHKAVWHITIVDIWSQNSSFSSQHPNLRDRVELKRQDREHEIAIERECRRCHRPFIATGTRSYRCPACAQMAEQERIAIWKLIHQPQESFITAEKACDMCSAADHLELHLIEDPRISILCTTCHDRIHKNDSKQEETANLKNPHTVRIPKMSGESSSCEDSPSSPEDSRALHEDSSSPYEAKKIEKKSFKNTDTKSLVALWEQIQKDLKQRFRAADYQLYIKDLQPTDLVDSILHFRVINRHVLEYLTEHKSVILLSCQAADLDICDLAFDLLLF